MKDPSAPSILELRDIRAGYGPIEVVHGISLEVATGSVMALLGPNGGGKTTLLNVSSGHALPERRRGALRGAVNQRTHRPTGGPGRVSAPSRRDSGIFPNLSVRENLLMATQVGVPMDRIEEVAYSQFPQLSGRRRQMAGTLSGGEQQMLALARAFATDPKLLLLDELSMGLAPIVVGQLYDKVRRAGRRGAVDTAGGAVRPHRPAHRPKGPSRRSCCRGWWPTGAHRPRWKRRCPPATSAAETLAARGGAKMSHGTAERQQAAEAPGWR